ncbi:hypothetical protein LTR70_003214 [Exophiala xenobiotica]|uniref:Nuclear pore complex protein Nup85 n=1 Tax=Lithohypha guttulata TaxID=1690604 RepID=A0ABR0KGL6_9EURO|nr:hypothetical protein LTR24_002859 [Lithohypha guttulata]KAK5323726.1 hypothetical protein LTR70_003214 [Exophiala xenobiotica]
MNRFTADFSSSTASTPGPQTKNRQYGRTPELASTTPLAPPPSQIFGSSGIGGGSGVSKLRLTQNARDLPSQPQPNNFHLSAISQESYEDDRQDYTDYMMEDGMEDDQYTQYTQSHGPPPAQSLMKFSTVNAPQASTKSSRQSSVRLQQYSMLPYKGSETAVPNLARDLRRRIPHAELDNDPDSVIVQTEEILRTIQEDTQSADQEAFDLILADSAKVLENIWEAPTIGRRRRKDEDLSIGPGHDAKPFEHARFLAIFLLRLYNASKVTQDEDGAMSIPQILLDWLNDYHMTIAHSYGEVIATKPNPTANDLFWDVVEVIIARGKFEEAMRVLGDADFSYAQVETVNGTVEANYNGLELQAIQTAVYRLRLLLNVSPSVQSHDWRIDGPDWIAYRRDVESALEELKELSDDHDDSELLEAERQDHLLRPGKSLPYEVFSRLQTIYNILLGSFTELKAISNDWLEASILLTVWWNGTSENKVQQWSFDVSRAHHHDPGNENGVQSYLKRLKESFLAVTDPSQKDAWTLPSESQLELALGLVLQGDIRSALTLIQTYSLCLTSALAELGSWSGWLNSSAVPDGLDKDDLMVLTNGASDRAITKDEILELYAHELFSQEHLQTSESTFIEGWEIAISVASRCDSQSLASRTVQHFIDQLTVNTADRAQRLITLCGELGMREESRKVSEQFGDHLVNTSSDYGTALLCYARSQAEGKVQKLIELLNSYCLVQSKAYPPEPEIDEALSKLVSNPRQALAGIAEADPQAVEILQFYLVGYACLRRYYTARDSSLASSKTSQKKVAAKALVAAINSAADSIYGGLYDPSRQQAIQVDGLLTLLGEATALTAEQNNNNRIFTSEQLYAILAAIEDLQTVSDRVYAVAEDCLSASLRQYHGSLPPSPHAMLKKSISSGTNSNFSFSMMGSEMLAQSSESLGGKSLGSGVLVGGSKDNDIDKDDVQRGWDWRSYFKGQDTTGADILRYLRRNIAQELSIANLEEGV